MGQPKNFSTSSLREFEVKKQNTDFRFRGYALLSKVLYSYGYHRKRNIYFEKEEERKNYHIIRHEPPPPEVSSGLLPLVSPRRCAVTATRAA